MPPALTLWFAQAEAATWTVDAAGTGDFATIQEAIDAASDADAINIRSGLYVEDVSLRGKSLSLIGEGSEFTWLSGATTAVDALGSATVTINGLAIDSAVRGLDADGELTLSDVTFEHVGDGSGDGGAIRMIGGRLIWTDGAVEHVSSQNGALYLESAEANLEDVSFRDTEAELGAAMYSADSVTTLVSTEFLGTSATSAGGLVYVVGGSLSATGVSFASGVTSVQYSAGCLYGENTSLTISDSSFTECETAEGGFVAAIFANGADLSVSGSAFANNLGIGYDQICSTEGEFSLTNTTIETPAASACGVWSVYAWPRGRDAQIDGVTLSLPYSSGCQQSFKVIDAGVANIGDVSLGACSATRCFSYLEFDADEVYLSGTIAGGSESGGIGITSSVFSVGPLAITGSALLFGVSGAGSISDVTGSAKRFAAGALGGDVTVDDVQLSDSMLLLAGSGSASIMASNVTLSGGGIGLYGGDITLDQIQLFSPTASGVYASGAGTVDIENLWVDGGSAGHWGSTGYPVGGGIFVGSGADVSVKSAYFSSNGDTSTLGGAIAVEGGSLDLESVVFIGNAASKGGAIWVDGGDLVVTNAVFQENTADEGSAVYVGSGFPDITNVTAVGNDATSGGAFHVGGGYLELTNAIVFNSSSGYGLSSDTASSATYSDLTYNDVFANAAGEYHTFADPTGTHGNLSTSPMFVAYSDDGDATNDDLRLAAGSPCVNTGDPRILDEDGTRSDIGAYGGLAASALDYDGDGEPAATDCDDTDPTVFPGATESCNGVDDDCDGTADEAGATGETTWYLDADGDGYGGTAGTVVACDAPADYAATSSDCDDTNPGAAPDQAEIAYDGVNNDCNDATVDDDLDADGFLLADDCDDDSAAIFPGASEACNGADDDCDGAADESGAIGEAVFFQDADGDGHGGHGDPAAAISACAHPAGYAESNDDCDDFDAAVSPDGVETPYDGLDNDCVAGTPDDDLDGDSFLLADDCDDDDASVNPAAAETCDGRDEDCDGAADESGADGEVVWYADADGDGHGDPTATAWACGQPAGYTESDDDCDDADPNAYPGAPEVAGNGVDEDCDGADTAATADTGGSGLDSGPSDTAPGLDTGAPDTAASTLDTAASTLDTAASAVDTADSALDTGDSAFDTADSALDTAASAFDTADSALDTADSVLDTADTADSALDTADSAHTADSATDTADSADTAETADTATDTADSAFDTADSADTAADSADSATDVAPDSGPPARDQSAANADCAGCGGGSGTQATGALLGLALFGSRRRESQARP